MIFLKSYTEVNHLGQSMRTPKIKYYTSVKDIPEDTLDYCLEKLTLGPENGCMVNEVSCLLLDHLPSPVCILSIIKPASWALLDYSKRIQVFTKPRYRKRGYASEVIQTLVKKAGIEKPRFYTDFYISCKKKHNELPNRLKHLNTETQNG